MRRLQRFVQQHNRFPRGGRCHCVDVNPSGRKLVLPRHSGQDRVGELDRAAASGGRNRTRCLLRKRRGDAEHVGWSAGYCPGHSEGSRRHALSGTQSLSSLTLAFSAVTDWLRIAVRGRQFHEWKRSFTTGLLQERHRGDCGLHFRLRLLVRAGHGVDDRHCDGDCFWVGHHDGNSRCFVERGGEIRGGLH